MSKMISSVDGAESLSSRMTPETFSRAAETQLLPRTRTALRIKNVFTGTGIFLAMLIAGFAQPIITKQPVGQSVSLGASVSVQVSATTTDPSLVYQWRFASTNLPSATKPNLTLTNMQLVNAGRLRHRIK